MFEDHNVFRERVDEALGEAGIWLGSADVKQILKAVSWRVEIAPQVIPKVHKSGKVKADPLRGLYEAKVAGKTAVVEYEPDSDLRDKEQVPLLEEGGIEAFIRREVLPYTPDAPRRSATRSASRGTSTSRNRCVRSKRSAPTFWRSRRRRWGCWMGC